MNMGEEHAILAYVEKREDGSISIRLDDARRRDSKTFEQVRLFTILNCSEEQMRGCILSDEQLAELGHAIVGSARGSADTPRRVFGCWGKQVDPFPF
jgi:hypothetical protein